MAHIVASSQHCLPQQPAQGLAPLPTSPSKGALRAAAAGAHNANSTGTLSIGGQEGDMLEAHLDTGKGPLGDRRKFIKFKLESRGVRKSSKDVEEAPQFHRGGGDAGREFLEAPMALCGRTLKMLHPSDKIMRKGWIMSWNSQKKEHRVAFESGGEPLDIDLAKSNWLLCNEAPAGQDTATRETDGKAPQGDTPHTTNYSSDKTDRETEFDGGGSAKGTRKRPANMALDDQFGLPQLSHGIGLIPPKGRRPYRSGGCKTGRYMKTDDLVGRRVHMWSSKDSVYVAAGVSEYDRSQGLHKVIYLDDTSEWINMESAIWRLGTSEHDSLYPEHFEKDVLGQDVVRDPMSLDGQRDIAAAGLVALAGADRGTAVAANANEGKGADDVPASIDMGPEVGKKLVASSMEFQVHKVNTPTSGYHVLCSVPPGTKIGDVHVTCGNACIIIEHGKNKKHEALQSGNTSDRLVILLPEAIRPSSATAKLTQAGKLAVFTSLA